MNVLLLDEAEMAEPELMYPRLTGMWAMRSQAEDGVLLVEFQTEAKPLRFSITVGDVFQVAERMVLTAMGAPEGGSAG